MDLTITVKLDEEHFEVLTAALLKQDRVMANLKGRVRKLEKRDFGEAEPDPPEPSPFVKMDIPGEPLDGTPPKDDEDPEQEYLPHDNYGM